MTRHPPKQTAQVPDQMEIPHRAADELLDVVRELLKETRRLAGIARRLNPDIPTTDPTTGPAT